MNFADFFFYVKIFIVEYFKLMLKLCLYVVIYPLTAVVAFYIALGILGAMMYTGQTMIFVLSKIFGA